MITKLPINHLTGVILAGGKSTRFGSDKAHAFYKGKSLITQVLQTMTEIFREVCVVTNFPEKYLHLPVFTDSRPFQGPAGGIVAALRAVKTDGIFVVACDMPLLSKEVILNLVEQDDGSPLVVYNDNGRYEPLCAIYRPLLIGLMELRLQKGKRNLHSLCELPGVRKVLLKNSEKKFLMNINTQDDLYNLSAR